MVEWSKITENETFVLEGKAIHEAYFTDSEMLSMKSSPTEMTASPKVCMLLYKVVVTSAGLNSISAIGIWA